ncbi:hypothetical protein [Paenibacillus polymyxa]|uniref:hypothetical protein n=1 Tax=Paenibacillus polymyxa TaxID=1406 RepID=UPI00287F4015|nr:hypothetical protein [Paenibacillus polymyxa]
MTQNSTVESFTNTKKLEEHFNSLSTMKIMVNDRKAFLTLSGTMTLFIFVLILISILFFMKVSGWLPAVISILGLLLTLSLLILSIRLSHLSAIKKYPEFSPLITKQKIRLSYDANFLFAYKCHEIKMKLKSLDFEDKDIDSLVEYFSMKSTNIKNKRWWPITLACLILFPLWSEFVGSEISKGYQMILLLIFFAFALIYVVYFLQSFFKDILLAKATKCDELINILKTIKML